jgi:hypothetical protein
MPAIDIIQNISSKFSDFIKDNLKDIGKLPRKQQQGISKAIRAFKVVLDDISENVKLAGPTVEVGLPVFVRGKNMGGVVMEINNKTAIVRTKAGLIEESIQNLEVIQ